MTKSRRIAGTLFTVAFSLVVGNGLYAQSTGSRQLGAEIQALEQRLASNISAAERHGTLVRLARLRQLSGNVSIAANLWLEAAALNPADDFSLVAGAYCLAAIGEWERAIAIIQPLLASGRRGASVVQARYLYATLRAWTASDISALVALAGDPEAAALRPIIFYTLWWTVSRDPVTFGGNGEAWRQRLISEYPRSPEARIVISEAAGASPSISAIHSPLWLLLPGVPSGTPLGIPEDSTLAELMRPFTPSQGTGTPPAPQAAPQAVQSPLPAAASPTHGQQTGLFRSETNAQNQAESLRRAGFPTVVSRRMVNGVEHWVVIVPSHDSTRTALELRGLGYDSFTVRLD